MGKCGAPDWTPYTAEEDQPVPGGIYPHSVWDIDGITQAWPAWFKGGSGTTTFYTVPAGKTLYLTSLYLRSRSAEATFTEPRIYVRDDGDTLQFSWYLRLDPTSVDHVVIPFPVPVEVPEGWYLQLYNSHAGLVSYVNFSGYTL